VIGAEIPVAYRTLAPARFQLDGKYGHCGGAQAGDKLAYYGEEKSEQEEEQETSALQESQP
jgi:hypothetical protein